MLSLNSTLLLAQEDLGTTAPLKTPSGTVPEKVETVRDTFQGIFNDIVGWAPNVLAMLVVLILGYLAARLIARVATALCETIGLQRAADRSGLATSMKQVGIQKSVPAIVGTVCFWLLLCVSLMAAFDVLGLKAVQEAMNEVVGYIPKILVAMVVVVIGLLVASFLRGIVATSADRVGVSYAEHLANGCYYVLALITFSAAATHLGLELELLNNLVLIAFGALAVGFALAFGLGGREVMGGIMSGYYIRQRFSAGDPVRIGEMEGTVRDVGPVATTVETDEGGLLHRHSVPNSVMLKEAVR